MRGRQSMCRVLTRCLRRNPLLYNIRLGVHVDQAEAHGSS